MTEIFDPKYARQAADRKAERAKTTSGMAQGRRGQEDRQRGYESTAKGIGAMAAVARAKAAYERWAYSRDRGYRVSSAHDERGRNDAHVDC